jgi:tetratricopeptide (TPR) repeat protein
MIEPSNSTQGISWLKGRGEAHQSQGDYDRAIADFEQVIELDPKYTTPYNKRAWAYYAKGNFDHAIVEYDQSTKLDPKDPTAFNGRASAYEAKGDHERAIADYDQAIWLNSEFGNALFSRGIAHFYMGELAKALADLNRANELYQTSVRLTRLGFPNHLQHDSRRQTEDRLPWGLRLRCERTFRARSFVVWRRG